MYICSHLFENEIEKFYSLETESLLIYETVLARLSMTGIVRGDAHDSQGELVAYLQNIYRCGCLIILRSSIYRKGLRLFTSRRESKGSRHIPFHRAIGGKRVRMYQPLSLG